MMSKENPFWCSNCLMMSTRPRISFDKNNVCNACQWSFEKKTINWEERLQRLNSLLDKYRGKNFYDCIVTVSGGKDGSYVAHNLKNNYNMRPLCVTITPPLPLELGQKNLQNFIESGYEHISINVNPNTMRKLDKIGFMKYGFPYYGWLLAIHTAPVRLAQKFGIELIFYSEDGEVEYGGMKERRYENLHDIEYKIEAFLASHYEDLITTCDLDLKDLFMFTFPKNEEINAKHIKFTHWSYYENWDPYRNYLIAKEHCGLLENEETNKGTFTNFAQTDQALYSLHTYIMYLKFGFGRATQDACIEIRRGAMDREQAKNLVSIYDNYYPQNFIETYLDYYQLDIGEFNNVIDKFANKELFEKIAGKWQPKFEII